MKSILLWIFDHDEQFGFTDDEVMKLLSDYDRSERYPDVKEWYDGYHFGNADIYCPWDVINFAEKLCFRSVSQTECVSGLTAVAMIW